MKKIIAVIFKSFVVLSLFLGTSLPVSAMENSAFGFTKEEIDKMSDSEYTQFIADVVNKDIPFSEIQSELSTVGVTISEASNNAEVRASSSSDVKLTIYSSHRHSDAYYYLTATVTAVKSISSKSGTEDLISIEWYPSKAKYYKTQAGQYTTYMDGSKRDNGIVLFNLDDSKLSAGKYAYCSVLVIPKSSNKITVEFGTKYIHTYDKTNYSWSIGGNIKYEKDKGLSGGLSFTVNGTASQYSWQRYADNAFDL